MKIQEILAEITLFLQEKDLSCTPRFRELAEAYAKACAELQEELNDCRELLQHHQLERAAARNVQPSPPLTERVRMLQFPGLLQYQELCKLYHLPVPQDFDGELVQTLERAAKECGSEKRDELLAQWRNTARTGTSHEKMLLLRKMIRVMPEDPVWQKNLETAERAYVADLQQEARMAQKLQDRRHLFSVYTQLTSAELSHPVPEAILAPFLADVRAYQQQETERRRLETLKQITQRYAAEDLPGLGAALERYQEIARSAFFHADAGAQAQVEEAQQFYQQKMTLLEQQKTALQLQKELRKQLDEQSPFPELDATFRKLSILSGFPVPEELKSRYQERAEQAELERNRRFRRRTVYGFLLAILGVAGAVFAIREVQHYGSIRRIGQEMQSFIDRKTPEKAIAYQEELLKQGIPEASAERILALRQQAEHLIAQYREESESFDRLLQEIRENITVQNAELPGQKLRFQAAEKFSGMRTPQQEAELQRLRSESADFCRKLQNERDLAFEKEVDAISGAGRALLQEMQKKETVSTADIEQRIFQLEQRTAALTGNAKRITPACLLRGSRILQDLAKLLRRAAQEVEQYQKTVLALNAPESIEEYRSALQRMPQTAPEKTPLFQAAASQLPGLESRLQIPWNALADPQEETLQTVFRLLLKGDPCSNDLSFILPSPGTLEKLKKSFTEFQNRTLPSWDLCELALPSAQGERRFYLKESGDVEVERSGGRIGGAYRALILNFVTGEMTSETAVLKLKRSEKGYLVVFPDTLKRPAGFPEDLLPIPSGTLDVCARRELPKAAHFLLMRKILERLQKADSISRLRQDLQSEILRCGEWKNLSSAAQSRVLWLLLDWYGEISPADREMADRLKKELRLEAAGDAEWLIPSLRQTDAPGRFAEFFASTPFKELRQTRQNTQQLYLGCIARHPIPAGVLYRRNGNLEFHPFKYVPLSEEYLVFLPAEDLTHTRLYRLPELLIRKKTIAESGLPALYSRIRHGEIVYVPKTLDKFESFFKKRLPAMSANHPEKFPVFRIPESIPEEMPER